MILHASHTLKVAPAAHTEHQAILSDAALSFVEELVKTFGASVEELLRVRAARQSRTDAGELPDFLPETQAVRDGEWTIAAVPRDLLDRRVEITAPTDRKMMISALNSGAKVFMADCEDSLAPTWENILGGQVNLRDAVRRTIELVGPEGKVYRLNREVATLIVRPRGWHLRERHITHAEVAAMIDRSPAAVRTAVWRARDALRQSMTEETTDDR